MQWNSPKTSQQSVRKPNRPLLLFNSPCSIQHRIEQGPNLQLFFGGGGGMLEGGSHSGKGAPHFPLPVINCDDV